MVRLGAFFAQINRRIQPDPMVLACLLTVFVAGVAVLLPQNQQLQETHLSQRALEVVRIWRAEIWNAGFLTFALQMCVVLLTGYGLAKAPPATRLLNTLAGRVRTNRGGIALVAVVSCAACWINWGFGLIAGGLLAAQVRRSLCARGVPVNYPLLVAAAYCGMMMWHGGLSGSAPLKVAGEGVTIQTETGSAQLAPLPVNRTVLSPTNLGLTAILIIFLPFLATRMAGNESNEATPEPEPPSPPDASLEAPSLADRINYSRVVPIVIATGLGIGLFDALWQASQNDNLFKAINLNFVNALFLTLGLALHRNLVAYVAAVAEGGRAITGIVLQFPLYSGIQGIMAKTGLAAAVSTGFADAAIAMENWGIAPGTTFPVVTFASAGLVNFFVPSGGGQWIVQGPIMCSAGHQLDLPVEQTVMAISYGDQWTNMVQPFWAIPLMGLTGVNAREFMGYCALLMLMAGPLFLLALMLM